MSTTFGQYFASHCLQIAEAETALKSGFPFRAEISFDAAMTALDKALEITNPENCGAIPEDLQKLRASIFLSQIKHSYQNMMQQMQEPINSEADYHYYENPWKQMEQAGQQLTLGSHSAATMIISKILHIEPAALQAVQKSWLKFCAARHSYLGSFYLKNNQTKEGADHWQQARLYAAEYCRLSGIPIDSMPPKNASSELISVIQAARQSNPQLAPTL